MIWQLLNHLQNGGYIDIQIKTGRAIAALHVVNNRKLTKV
jgi:hypothetical protein